MITVLNWIAACGSVSAFALNAAVLHEMTRGRRRAPRPRTSPPRLPSPNPMQGGG